MNRQCRGDDYSRRSVASSVYKRAFAVEVSQTLEVRVSVIF